MLTRAAPVASAARSDSSSRMPPDSSTFTSSGRPRRRAARRWSRGRRRRRGRPGGPTRRRRAARPAPPPAGRRSAVSVPAAPCTRRTAWPSATSTAGSRVRRHRVSSGRTASDHASTGSGQQQRAASDRDPQRHVSTQQVARSAPIAGQHQHAMTARCAAGCAGPAAGPAAAARRVTARGRAGARRRRRRGRCSAPGRGLARPARAAPAPPRRSPRRRARSLAHSVRDPVAQQRGAGVAGLLRVELGRADSGPRSTAATKAAAVLGGGHQAPSVARSLGVAAAYEWTK